MNGQLILTSHTYSQGMDAIDTAFSGQASFAILSATTMISGTTNLYNIFGSQVYVQPGTNISTGGTGNFPIINTVNSPSFNNLSASGNTYLSLGSILYKATPTTTWLHNGNSTTSIYLGISAGTITTIPNNVGVGAYSLSNLNPGSIGKNTAIGSGSMQNCYDFTTGTVAIGYQAAQSAISSNSIFIGTQAGISESMSNVLYISNANPTPLISGNFAGNSNQNTVGINILPESIAATTTLHVNSNTSNNSFIKITNNGTGTGASDGLNIGICDSNGTQYALINNNENTNLNIRVNNADRFVICTGKTISNNSWIDLFTISINLSSSGGVLNWSINTWDGSSSQSNTGIMYYSVISDGTTASAINYNNQISATTSGSIYTIFSADTSGSNQATIMMNTSSSLTPIGMLLYYTLTNNSNNSLTIY